MNHYILIKREGLSAAGAPLDAADSAIALLTAKAWPLWRFTPNRVAIRDGDAIAVYLAGPGESRVIATAKVAGSSSWTRALAKAYPLMVDGTPERVLLLDEVHVLDQSIDVRERIARLSFVRPGQRKWGVHFTSGARAVSAADYAVLTSPTLPRRRPAESMRQGDT